MGQALSRRERSVLLLMSRGNTNRQISRLMCVGEDTVKYHLKNLYEKLGARRRTEAVLLAQKRGLLPLGDVIERTNMTDTRASRQQEHDIPMEFTSATMDTSRRYVRVRGESNGLVEFDFAIGEPELFVELMLRPEALAEFCATNQVEFLDTPETVASCSHWDWRLADAARIRSG